MLGEKRAPLDGKLLEIGLRQIVGGRLRELGLPAVVDLRAARKIEIGNRVVGLDAGERRVERFAADALRRRIGPKALDEGVEILRSLAFAAAAAKPERRTRGSRP